MWSRSTSSWPGVRREGAVVQAVADAVAIVVGVAGVAGEVTVGVELVGVGQHVAVVSLVQHAVVVVIGVAGIAHAVEIHVTLLGIRDNAAVKLLDGTKAYLHAVIDDFSRRVLAWTVADRLDPMNTRDVLVRAASNLERSTKAEVYMDSGVENLNTSVDELFRDGALRRVIAQIDVSFSNSLIESWWRSLKHQ